MLAKQPAKNQRCGAYKRSSEEGGQGQAEFPEQA